MNKHLHIIIWLMAFVGWMHPALAQTDSLCVSSPVNNYFVTPTPGSSYFWDTQGDGVINSGQGTSGVNISWPAVAGTYQLSVTETSSDGCIGLPQLLQVVVFPAYYDTTELTVCASALPVLWNGNNYNTAGTYDLVLSSIAGCDSIATLVLSVDPLLSPVLTCGTSSTSSVEVVWSPVTGATSYLLDYSVNGSPVGVGLSVVVTGFSVNGLSPSDVVSFTITPVGVDGCFASASISCTAEDCVPPVVNSSPVSQSVCEDEGISFSASVSGASGFQWQLSFDGGTTFTNATDDLVFSGSTTPTLSISSVSGLDGLVVQLLALEPNGSCPAITPQATLTVNSLPTIQFTASDLVSPPETMLNCATPNAVIAAAGGISYVWSGGQFPLQAINTFESPGTYTVEVENAAGCTSVGSITLTGDFSTFSSSVNVQRCDGESYTLPDGSVVSASGVYPVTLEAVNGCDSVITTTVDILPSPNTNEDISICDAQLPYSWNGNTYTSAGSYSITLSSAAGCDSIVTLNLTVSPTITASEDISICDAQLPYSWNGNTYTSAGSYSVTLSSAAGCDSVVTLNLSVSPTLTASEDISICDAQLPYSWNGDTYTAAGSYSVTLSTTAGCDSVVTLNLAVSPSLTASEDISICDAQLPYNWNGNTYISAGSYSVTLSTAAGCDSLVTLNLSVSPTLTASQDISICDAQLPYSWNGNTYTSAGSYSVTLSTAAGCDSVATLNLTVSPSLTASQDISICDAQLPYSWNGNTYTSAGSYSVTLSTAAGCDSVVTLNLTVSPSLTASQDISICDAQLPYNWNGNTYTSAGSYSVTLSTAAGCDSVVTLNLSVSPTLTSSQDISICDAQLPYSWNGNTITSAGSYSVTLSTAAGCDSIVTLNLTVSPSLTASQDISICDAQLPYNWNGNTYTSAGSYSVTLSTSAGCDSVVTLNLTVLPSLTTSQDISICDAQLPYSWNGNTYTSAGSYSVTLSTTAGCDSAVTLNLTVSPSLTASEDINICDAQLPYNWNGNSYTSAGSYSVTLSTAAGCDSVVTLNLTVSPSLTASQDISICDAQLPYSWNGNTYTSAGSYSVTLSTAAGCDSVVTLNLNVSPTITVSEDITICDTQLPYSWNGNIYTSAGSYSVTLSTAAGCDSVVTLNLSVSPTLTASQDINICDAQLPYSWNGNTYTAAGSYSVTLSTAAGCDSVVTLNLNVSPTITASEDISICDAQLPYSWNGNAYTSAGSYSVTLSTAAGCDSVVTLNLNVSPTITVSENISICDAQLPYSWNGNIYTSAGSYSVTLSSAAGCDSIVTLNLTVSPTITASEDISICDAQLPYSWNGNSYTSAGSYSVTLSTAAGCDSIVTLNLTVSPSLTASQDISICDAQLPYSWNGNTYTSAGNYSVTLSTAAGCDSVVTLNLTVSPSLTASQDISICDAQLPYSWNGNTYNSAGSYAVTLSTASGCDSVVTLNLTVSPSLTASQDISICDAQLPYSWNGNSYTSAGSYSVTLSTAAGCDSVVILNLSVSPTLTSSQDISICDAQLPYSWNGNSYTSAGSYSVTLSTAAGCDSVVTLNLSVSPSLSASQDISICDAQLPYSWNGNTYTSAGSYSVTLSTAAGCDSVVTLNLSVSPTLTASEDISICDAQLPYNWNGNSYTSAGSYSVTLSTAAGCDSVVTLNLSVSPSLTASEDINICDAQLPYSWNGNSYTSAGSYSVTLSTAAGCDSVVTLNLTVSPSLTASQDISICDVQLPYNWNGNIYTSAGSYSVTLSSAAGCDSLVTLNLSVSPTLTASQDISICDAQLPYSWNGNAYTSAGSYSVTLSTAAGCDSVVTLNLTVSPSLTASQDISICDAQLPYSWNGNTYTSAGSYSVTLSTAAGCDSVVTLNLSVSPTLTASQDINICDAQLPYSWNGNTYTAAGSYSVTLSTAAGCDSVVTLNLTVSPSLTANEDISICDAQLPYSWNGNSYTSAGSYSVTLSTAAGCDSVVTLNLTVSPTITASEDISICDAQLPYSWNGNSYTSAGSYSVTLSTAAGCDSVVTLNLSVSPTLTASQDISICDAQLPYNWNGNIYTSAGSYSVTLSTAAGCDSVVTLNLSVSPSLSASQDISICDAQLPYSWNGNTYTSAGSYSVTLSTAAGCDSVVTLNLSVSPTLTASEDISICDTQLPYSWNGNTYTSAGSYSATLSTAAGCDSVATLNLTVSPSLTANEDISICDAQLPYSWNGNSYTSAGSYSVTLSTAAGCDSIVTLNLTVSPSLTASQDISICDAQLPYNWNGNTYTSAGSYSVTLSTAAGCDSLVTLNLSVSPSLTASEDITICDAQLPYSWNGNTYTSAGSYSVTLSTAAGCDSVVTLNLSVSPSLTASQDISICDAQLPYNWNGNTYTSAGSYSVTLSTAAGCDSVVTLNLSVSPTLTSSQDISICDAQLPYSWNGNIYTSAGSYSVTLSTAAGCDSVVTLNLSVSPSLTASQDISICDAQLPYNWNGNTYTSAGSYSVTLSTAAGCDSVATLNLSVSPTLTASQDISICDAQLPYNWNGNTYISAGSYSVTLSTAAGCDSLVTLNLSVSPTLTASQDISICDAQLPYSWNGNTYTSAGSYSVTLSTAAGCDSVATLNLTVSPSLTASQDISICDAQLPYSWNGNTYTSAGSYSVTLSTAAGCDSVVTLNLSVSPTITASEDISICDAQLPYSWNGNTITSAGSYSVTLSTAAGCDSIVTLNLTVSPSLTASQDISICDAQLPYSWNGNTYTSAGSYSVTLSTAAGCDSVVTLNLTVSPTITASEDISICDAQLPYSWNGNSYTSAGSYSVTLSTAAGCDSVVTLNLTVSPSLTASEDISICDAQLPYNWNGNIYTSAGSYPVTLSTAAGCDSVVTLNLTVSPSLTASQDISICDAQLPYSWNGNAYTSAGSYSVTLSTSAGCDSVVTLNLTVSPTLTASEDVSICDAQLPYSWNGNIYTSAGSYSVTLSTSAGCDSVVTLNLTVSPSLTASQDLSICDAQLPYSWNGNSYTSAGSYSVTLSTAAGCDSVVTLNLTVSPSLTASEDISICDAQLPYNWNGNIYTSAGSYPVTLSTAAGCDSVVTLNLTVSPSLTASQDISICDAQLPYSWNGNTYTSAGSYSVTLSTSEGCDSVVTLNLTVSPSLTASEDISICDAQLPYSWNGNSYTSAGSYSLILNTAAGCDSVVTLNLTVSPSLTASQDISICDAQLPYNWNGNIYTSAGSYSVTLSSAAGCDSIVTLNLSVSPTITASEDVSICDAQLPYSWNGNSYTAAGSYSVTLSSAAGCDSVVTLNLSVSPTITASEDVSICDAQLPYSWNGNSYTAAGSYSVTLSTAAGCDSVVTLNLSIHSFTTSVDVINSCTSITWIDGNTYSTSNNSATFTIAGGNAQGCDSVITLNLTITPTLTSSQNVSICSGSTYILPDGTQTGNTGVYTSTLQTAQGCDSIITTTLSITPPPVTAQNASICAGSTFILPDGTQTGNAGVYTSTLQTAQGCDSIITTTLSILPVSTTTSALRFCAGNNFTLPWGEIVNSPGTYTQTLSSAAGCDSILVVNLSADQPVELAISPDTSICSGQSVQLSAAGASDYFWSPGSSLSDSTSSTALATPTITTTYTVVGMQGACLDTATVTVTVLPSPQPQISASPNPICLGDSVLVQVSGATSYLWTGEDVPCDTCSTFWISPDTTINLQLIATTGICSITESLSIGVLNRPVATISGDTSLCFGDTLLLVASGGGTYVWSDGTSNDTLQYLPLNSTFVSVIVSNGVCQDTAQVAVMVNPLPVVDAGTDTTIYFGGTASLLGSANAGATWYPAHDLSCTDCFEPLSTTPFTETYCLTAVNAYGCVSTDCVEITVDTLCAGLFVPNVFAPDEGGHSENNCFRLYGADCVSSMTLNVFNRWGEKVYESRNPGDCWDGTFRGQQLNTGVYVFYLEAKLITGETLNRQGNLTLIR